MYQLLMYQPFMYQPHKLTLRTLDSHALNQLYYDAYGIDLNEGFLLHDKSKSFPIDKLDMTGVSLIDLARVCSQNRYLPQRPLLDHYIHNDVFCRIAETTGLLDVTGTNPSNAGRQFRHIHNWLRDERGDKINAEQAVKILKGLGYDPVIIGSQWQEKLEAKSALRGGTLIDKIPKFLQGLFK